MISVKSALFCVAVAGAYYVAACNNIAQAPKSGPGKQFVTGACQSDADCASGCCERSKKTCRNALALSTNSEFCMNGFTPVFDGAPCAAGSNSGNSTPSGNPPPSNGNNFPKATSRNVDQAPKSGPGKQFVTGPCQSDADCASGCCEVNKKTCRNALALSTNVEFCMNGFTPFF